MPCIYPKIYILLKSTKYFMMKAFKFRLYPTINQSSQLNQHIGICRFVYNWALNQKVKTYEQIGKSISRFDLNKLIPNLKQQNPWLRGVNSQSFQGMANLVESAFNRFFREKIRFLKFESKKIPIKSFLILKHYNVDFESDTIKFTKTGEIKAIFQKTFEGELKTATTSRSCTGKYYISILVGDDNEFPVKQVFSEYTAIGVEVGINNFTVLSIGEKVENPNYLENSLKRLKTLQKKVSRKQNSSPNREKAKQKLTLLRKKITNKKNDFQHKLSFQLVSEIQAIAFETPYVKYMIKNYHLAQAICDSVWSSFVTQSEYKSELSGKPILLIGKFVQSFKMCLVYGYHNSYLTLKDGEWNCADCKTKHDRDINAAINIKKFYLTDQNLIGI
jgi:putative transposase